MEQPAERLDAVSKALLACHAITHMLCSLQGVMINSTWLEHARNKDPKANEGIGSVFTRTLREGIESKEKFLEDTVSKLADIADEVGEFMAGGDMVTEIDIRILRPFAEIVGEGLDEVENPYDGPVPNPAPPFS